MDKPKNGVFANKGIVNESAMDFTVSLAFPPDIAAK
jgi:hypothetical protein